MPLQICVDTRHAQVPYTSKPHPGFNLIERGIYSTNFCNAPGVNLRQASIQGGLLFKDLRYVNKTFKQTHACIPLHVVSVIVNYALVGEAPRRHIR